MAETIKIGKRTFTVLFPDLLRPLNEAELTGLRADIKANGVRVPVIVDEADGVIDGINRLTLAAEAGWGAVPVDVHKGLTHEQKHALAISVNANRRHCTRKELQDAIARELTEDPTRSNRKIAEEVGTTDKTVARVRKVLESGAESPHLIPPNTSENDIPSAEKSDLSPTPVIPKTEKRVGKDGKPQAAKKKPPKAPVAMKDGKGNDVPDNLRDVFADRTLIETHDRLEEIEQSIDADGILSRVKARIKFLPYVLYDKLSEHLTQVEASLELARDTLKAGIPFAVCSKCGGKGTGCKQCRLAGYIPEWRHKEIEIEGV